MRIVYKLLRTDRHS